MIRDQHAVACHTLRMFSHESADPDIGHLANRYGEQWIVTVDRVRGAAR